MKTPAKKKIMLNIIMVVAIIAIFAAGMLTVGSVKGWFDGNNAAAVVQADGTIRTVEVTAQKKIGSANIERSGVAYSLKNGAKLRDGDMIQTLNGSSIDIVFGVNRMCLNENSCATVHIADTGALSVDLDNGGVFVDVSEPFILRLMETDVSLVNGVFSASAPYGSASVYVFENTATIGGKVIKAGHAVSLLQDGVHITALSIQSLNSFDLACITTVNESQTLCFSNAQIEQLTAERAASMQAAAQAQLLVDENAQKVEKQRQENEKKQTEITSGGNSASATNAESAESAASAEDSGSTESAASSDSGTSALICFITIRCDTILDNMADLAEGKDKHVPANGCILATAKLTFEEGETVFDILKRACSITDIQLEYAWTPMYNSYYIEGINNLYEFDCGNESGWMYQVNGWFPNYGCSSYTLEDGDEIVWCYTCKGLGADVGGSVY